MHTTLWQLMYLCKSSVPFDDAALQQLLIKSQQKNLIRDISGFLIYHDSQFFQVLEGEKGKVHDLYDRITRDPRAGSCRIAREAAIVERDFPLWSMAYLPVASLSEGQLHELDAYDDFLLGRRDSNPADIRPGAALSLLKSFRATIQRKLG